jgi:hypothetical protein
MQNHLTTMTTQKSFKTSFGFIKYIFYLLKFLEMKNVGVKLEIRNYINYPAHKCQNTPRYYFTINNTTNIYTALSP